MPPKDTSPPDSRALWQYVGPFGLFIVLQAVPGLLRTGAHPSAAVPFWRAVPEFWLYPLQTVLCAALLLYFRSAYPRWINVLGIILGTAVGVLVLLIWVSPQFLFHAAPRTSGGFDPYQVPPAASHHLIWFSAAITLRFVRLVTVVPMLEEVFWRGFLLRYLVREDFTAVPFGTFTPLSFGVVAIGFMLEHSTPDWPAALIAGALYNFVAIRSKSLPACILAHAVTNLLLGCYIMQTHQWGFW